jgi:hypothetical protein
VIILTNREGNDVPHVFRPEGSTSRYSCGSRTERTTLWGRSARDGCVAPRAEAEELLGSSIEGAIEMCLPLWRRVWGALGTGTLNIRVVR